MTPLTFNTIEEAREYWNLWTFPRIEFTQWLSDEKVIIKDNK